MVILELCECSLKTHIMSHPENAPACSEDVTVRKNVLLWVFDILDALRYVHEQEFVHRDLKLDNLLVSKKFSIHVILRSESKPLCFQKVKRDQKGQRADTQCYVLMMIMMMTVVVVAVVVVITYSVFPNHGSIELVPRTINPSILNVTILLFYSSILPFSSFNSILFFSKFLR